MEAVAINSSAGNFCSSTCGAFHKLTVLSGYCAEYKRRLPFEAFGKAQKGSGFAIHCHCFPNCCVLNSSDSWGVRIGNVLPTLGFLYRRTGSPLPSPSLSVPITGQLFNHFMGCRCTILPY